MIRDNDPPEHDDQALRDEFRSLRELEVPPTLHPKCLAAANAAVSVSAHRSAKTGTRARQRAVMFASAVAASLFVGIGVGWVLRGKVDIPDINQRVTEIAETTPVHEIANVMATSAVHFDERLDKTTFRREETYLCGVGRIRSKSMIQLSGE